MRIPDFALPSLTPQACSPLLPALLPPRGNRLREVSVEGPDSRWGSGHHGGRPGSSAPHTAF